MKDRRLYLLRITIEKGADFNQTFVGLPNREEIVEAINLARMAAIEKSTDPHVVMVEAKYDNFVTLIQDYWNSHDKYKVCVYASVSVGNIELKEGAIALETKAACLTSDT